VKGPSSGKGESPAPRKVIGASIGKPQSPPAGGAVDRSGSFRGGKAGGRSGASAVAQLEKTSRPPAGAGAGVEIRSSAGSPAESGLEPNPKKPSRVVDYSKTEMISVDQITQEDEDTWRSEQAVSQDEKELLSELRSLINKKFDHKNPKKAP
jgi:hypothetical protein